MRSAACLFVAAAVSSGGCSLMIADAGQNLTALKTREQVRESFGEPDAIGVADDRPVEEFHTRRHITDPMHRVGLGLAVGVTNGGLDVILFPVELAFVVCRAIVGRTVTFTYDEAGRVVRIRIDGRSYPDLPNDGWWPKPEDEAADPDPLSEHKSD